MKMRVMLTVFNSINPVLKQGEINKLQNRAFASYHSQTIFQLVSNRFYKINIYLTIEFFYYNGIRFSK